jgi:hypothetical protein
MVVVAVMVMMTSIVLVTPTTQAFNPTINVKRQWRNIMHQNKLTIHHQSENHQSTLLSSRRRPEDDDDDDREYARVRRGRARYDDDDDDREYDENIMSAVNQLEEDGIFDDDDDEFDDEFEDDEIRETFANVLIPNPVLDSIDPDGAAERFPELARDPKFWFELVLFFTVLDFLSFMGPRSPFDDLPGILSNAQLPPPGM